MLLDRKRLDILKSDETEEEKKWLKGLIAGVIEDINNRVHLISKLNEENLKELISEYHKVSGVAANFGLVNLHKIASTCESSLKKGNIADALAVGSELQSTWIDTKKELESYNAD